MKFIKDNSQVEIKFLVILSCISCLLSTLWHFNFIFLFVAAIIIIVQYAYINNNEANYKYELVKKTENEHILEGKIKELETEERLQEIEKLKNSLNELNSSICNAKKDLSRVKKEQNDIEDIIKERTAKADAEIEIEIAKKQEQVKKEAAKVAKLRELYKSVKYSIDNFFLYDVSSQILKFDPAEMKMIDELVPSVMLHLQNMNSKELKKAFKDNDKQITKVMETYSSRYTTKANKAIYSLMVIALRAELQNVLAELKYGKIDKSVEDIQKITTKYLSIAGEGNQAIAGTLTKFISQLEYLFINAAKIEYNYYIKKEKEKQEQIALKEKMREEAAERKALEQERKKIEQEESKYETEIQKLKEQMENAAKEEMDALNKRILELQEQLSDVIVKKEDIVNLQNGRAGTVYIISNLGSFGDDVFKIGMTRRLEPQERINELGSASVPFKFDVHSFIFSNDAVALESKMHEMLTNKRLNKVNMRKEFFKVSIDDLEKLVEEIEPTAEFNRTMIANEYRASLEADEIYTENYFVEEGTLVAE